MSDLVLLLAQTPTSAPAQKPDFFGGMLVPLLLMLVVFYFILFRGGRKDRQRQEQMLKAIKRNDRVQTIGGILGTVVDVRDNEVVLKVDETNNVKMHFNRTAIKEVLSEPAPEGKS